MNLYLFNTINQAKELFKPIDDSNIKIYVCGPTVYDYPHIGNARSIVVYDILYRVLIQLYGKKSINYVRNITDVDDKINERAKEKGISIKNLTVKTIKDFHFSMEYLNCISPNVEPKATENISQMIDIIKKLLENNHAYIIENEVLFSVNSFDDYYRLSNRNGNDLRQGVRNQVDDKKHHPFDFVLWKPALEEDDESSIFDSPWGKGRPGWHIECSAMSYRFLGENFDIHGGGSDLIFPHHTNEIAQSKCAFPNSTFANYWVHNGFLTVNNEKMSKSLGNFVTVQNLIDKGVKGEIIRFLLLNTHYRKPLNFSEQNLDHATKSMNYLYRTLENFGEIELRDVNIDNDFLTFLLDDLNTHNAIDYLINIANKINKNKFKDNFECSKLIKNANFLGLLISSPQEWFQNVTNNQSITEKIMQRNLARKNKDWKQADLIRIELENEGILIEDNIDGSVKWRKK